MADYHWDITKNLHLIQTRGISFEHVVWAINNNQVLDINLHHDQKRYPEQYRLIININNYAYVVPLTFDKDHISLLTIFPSRKATARYLRRQL